MGLSRPKTLQATGLPTAMCDLRSATATAVGELGHRDRDFGERSYASGRPSPNSDLVQSSVGVSGP